MVALREAHCLTSSAEDADLAPRPPKYVDTSKSIRRAARHALTGRVSWSVVTERVRARGAVAHVRWARDAIITTEEQKLATATVVVNRCALQ